MFCNEGEWVSEWRREKCRTNSNSNPNTYLYLYPPTKMKLKLKSGSQEVNETGLCSVHKIFMICQMFAFIWLFDCFRIVWVLFCFFFYFCQAKLLKIESWNIVGTSIFNRENNIYYSAETVNNFHNLFTLHSFIKQSASRNVFVNSNLIFFTWAL